MQLDNIRFTSQQLLQALSILPEQANLRFDASQINNITLDSRNTDLHTAFVAVKGSVSDGFDYIESALGQNCKLIICEKTPDSVVLNLAEKAQANVIVLDNLRDHLPLMLAQLFESVSLDEQSTLPITAVTGTNGKTSVAALYAQLSHALFTKSASMGTLGLNILTSKGEEKSKRTDLTLQNIDVGSNTTPDIITHYKALALLRQQGISRYCLEASSHGIEQGRLSGLPIQTAILTNLTQDHLDYHHTMQAYAQAKRALLANGNVKYVVLNAHDKESLKWQSVADSQSAVRIVWFALSKQHIPSGASHFVSAQDIQSHSRGFSFELITSWGNAKVQLPLLGRFNILNFFAAIAAHLIEGSDLKALLKLVPMLRGVPGRMELFSQSASQNGNLIVDYAHTPDALEQALKAAREHTKGKLYCVFGCGGNRDKSKRALMGQAAAKYSDGITLTQDNSRDERPEDIIRDIKQGIGNDILVKTVLERKEAVRTTWQMSKQNDLILLAGKGHEDYLEIKQQKLPYNEREYAKALCAEAVA